MRTAIIALVIRRLSEWLLPPTTSSRAVTASEARRLRGFANRTRSIDDGDNLVFAYPSHPLRTCPVTSFCKNDHGKPSCVTLVAEPA
jgi:hypothetical protein